MSDKVVNSPNDENLDLADDLIGQVFGAYQIKSEIGRGGMGVVYLAERIDGVFRQEAAIKFIKRGMDTDAILKRFRNERQILATLNHPNVALLYDGGTTKRGLPYFVMEYVNGETLYEYCDQRKLGIKERLKIFLQVCEGIHAAHQIKVVHRDLKPSNILIKADGTPKLLDFGIAKMLDPNIADATLEPTATQLRMMTPEYASPEQISGEPITTISDIYSLGVLLYELLSGYRPYHLKNRSPIEVARVICEELPESLSDGLNNKESEAETLEQVLESRGSSFEKLSEELSGDLKQIVFNALQKSPADRYQTALEFAEDISLYLSGNPIKKNFPKHQSLKVSKINNEKNSVAVLPLKIIGANSAIESGDEFLRFGLADALILRLSAFKRLIVRPTSSILHYGQSDSSAFAAGEELGVEYVVEGTIRRVGERVRISVQLLNVSEQRTYWAQSFDEKFTDVLEIEDVVSGKIIKTLIPQLSGEERNQLANRGTNNIEAYEACLRGRYYWNLFTNESLVKSLESFNQAISLDPNYAAPHVGLADYYVWLSIFGLIPSKEGFPKAKAAALRALEIDENSGEAYAVLGFSVLCYDWNWKTAEVYLKRGLELAPNYSLAHEFYSDFLITSGHFEEGIQEIRKAEELAPLSPRALLMTAWTLYQTGNFAESVKTAATANEMQKDFSQGLLHLGNALTQFGKTSEAVEKLKQSLALWKGSGMPEYMLCFALVADGKTDEAIEIAADLALQPEVKPFFVAMAYVAIDQKDLAFEWFEKAFEERNEWFIWFGIEPKFDSVRKDPRYLDLLNRTNNPIREFQQTSEVVKEQPIAVLPFKLINKNSSGEEEYLGIGLADALISRLSNIRRFVLRPTSSVLSYTENKDPFVAADELKVDYIVDGTIRRIGEQIRVSVQLLDVKNRATQQAEVFDEVFTDILEIEDSISERVVRSLVPHLTGEEEEKLRQRATNEAEAYKAFMHGRYFWNQFTNESILKSIEWFQEAVSIDPNYALAYVGIADFYNWACVYGMLSSAESYPKSDEAIKKALEINSDLGEAHTTLGFCYSNHRNWKESEKTYRRAMELIPHYPLVYEGYSAISVGLQRFDDALLYSRKAEELNPLNIRQMTLSAWTFYQARLFDKAVAKSFEIIAVHESHPQGYMQLCNLYGELGRFEEAISLGYKSLELMPDSYMMIYPLCFALNKSNRLAEAQKIVENLKESAKTNYVKNYFLALSHFAINEIDIAFDYLKRSFEENDPWKMWLPTEPKLDGWRNDKRFIAIMEKYYD